MQKKYSGITTSISVYMGIITLELARYSTSDSLLKNPWIMISMFSFAISIWSMQKQNGSGTLSGDPNVDALGAIHGSIPPIWKTMVDHTNCVRSNYGWQWERNHQLDKVVQMLQEKHTTRQAVISIYDGKEIDTYRNDTPCTYAVTFTRLNGALNMSVLMRSNDLWFGFCNDQYCFSKLQEMVALRVGIPVGTYYHHATNLHLYDRHLGKDPITII